jgi:hypothetical protein
MNAKSQERRRRALERFTIDPALAAKNETYRIQKERELASLKSSLNLP